LHLKLGDLVIRRDEPDRMIFKVIEFSGNQVILQGQNMPIITISEKKRLIKLNRERLNDNCLKIVK